jgi:hypothetical protein
VSGEQKILSVYEPDVQVIVRGKAGREVEFGNTLLISESPQGLILDGELYRERRPRSGVSCRRAWNDKPTSTCRRPSRRRRRTAASARRAEPSSSRSAASTMPSAPGQTLHFALADARKKRCRAAAVLDGDLCIGAAFVLVDALGTALV